MSDDDSMMSASVKSLFEALSKAQAKIEGAKKDAVNPHLKNRYADLASVWAACRAVLPEFGLCVVQTTRQSGDKGVCVVTMLGHASGEWIRGEMYMPASRPDAQGFGSALTYARRYGLAAIVGVSPDDDDGQAAANVPKPQGGPIKPPAQTLEQQAVALPVQLAESVTILALAAKVKTAMARAPNLGALNEEWAAFHDIKKDWPKSLVREVVDAKDQRRRELEGRSRSGGAAAE